MEFVHAGLKVGRRPAFGAVLVVCLRAVVVLGFGAGRKQAACGTALCVLLLLRAWRSRTHTTAPRSSERPTPGLGDVRFNGGKEEWPLRFESYFEPPTPRAMYLSNPLGADDYRRADRRGTR
jgi:hypothetical protein